MINCFPPVYKNIAKESIPLTDKYGDVFNCLSRNYLGLRSFPFEVSNDQEKPWVQQSSEWVSWLAADRRDPQLFTCSQERTRRGMDRQKGGEIRTGIQNLLVGYSGCIYYGYRRKQVCTWLRRRCVCYYPAEENISPPRRKQHF